MNIFLSFKLKHVGWVLGLAVAVSGVALAAHKSAPVHADNKHIVTIYADGQQRVLATEADNVGEVLKRAEIPLGEHDAVEPAKDSKLVAQTYNVNVYRARPVTVIDGDKRYRVMSPYQSAQEIAKSAGLEVYDEDTLTLDRIDNFLAENGVGLKLTIQRSTPVNLMLYGTQVTARTQAKTVGELLKDKQITLAGQDGVSPGAETPITAGMSIAVYRNGSQTITEEHEVPFETEQIQDRDREIGFREVREAGTKGRKVVTYQIELRDGKEIARKEIQSVVTVQPKKQVEVVGAKTAGFGGDFGSAISQLRGCESGGRYDRNSGNGYYGAYQYDISTWGGYGGYARADLAPPAVQDQKVFETYSRRGWSPWPSCSRKLGLQDIYR